jgi:nucleotide-binding universal stress UspA family protein
VVLSYAKEAECNLLMMANRAKSGRMPIDNVSARIVRDSNYPVMLVKVGMSDNAGIITA